MSTFPLNREVFYSETDTHRFYIQNCGNWKYAIAYSKATGEKCLGGFTTLKKVKECVHIWMGWMGR